MSIDDLSPLIGRWELTGRSYDHDTDNVAGTMTCTPLLGGAVLQLTGTMRAGGQEIPGLELVWYDETAGVFPAHVYGRGAPLPYRWERTGPDTLLHAGMGCTYRGTISADGRTITGRWEPDPGTPRTPATDYTAVMRRVD